MKKFLMVSALSILFSPSITTCSEKNSSNGARTLVGLALLGFGAYKFLQYINSNTSSDNPSGTQHTLHEHQQKEDLKSIKQLMSEPHPSNPEKHSENNNSEEKKESEKQESTDNKTLSSLRPKSNPEKKPSNGNPTQCQKNTSTPIMNTEKEISFFDALRARFKESEIELDAKRLLTEHAFSN